MTGRNPWPPSAKRKTAKKRKLPKMTKEDTQRLERIQEKIERARQVARIQAALRNVQIALHSVDLAIGDFIHDRG